MAMKQVTLRDEIDFLTGALGIVTTAVLSAFPIRRCAAESMLSTPYPDHQVKWNVHYTAGGDDGELIAERFAISHLHLIWIS
jgi:hypothetical protein